RATARSGPRAGRERVMVRWRGRGGDRGALPRASAGSAYQHRRSREMLNRGQRTFLAAVWAVVGTCLANAGCEPTMGPAGPGLSVPAGYPTAQVQPATGWQLHSSDSSPASTRQPSAGVLQISHTDLPALSPRVAPSPAAPGAGLTLPP